MQVLSYSEQNLALSLSNDYTTPQIVASKNHFNYFKNYLGGSGLQAKTIIVEENYISKDFLHDYVSYYSLCFEHYPKVCKRVHLFDIEISGEVFATEIIKNPEENKDFWDHYLGFIVVKPIPVKNIGYTVLRTYNSRDNALSRSFWGTRNYRIHVFGNKIRIKSLAFQEQDSVLAACATTAIWIMLNKAAVDFHTILKSPSQITKDADSVSSDGSRLFPNKGLNLLQICQAILNSGLVSEVKSPDVILRNANNDITERIVSNTYLKKILNAYSPIGIPIILVIKVPNGDQHGLHAIAVSGFNFSEAQDIQPNPTISWKSENIDKIYAHDDQWGPFARINLKENHFLETPWTDFDNSNRPTKVTHIVVPIYPKIRISYEDIEVLVLGLDQILTLFFKNLILADLVWDIKIKYSEDFKTDVKSGLLEDSEKISFLGKSLPKYIWIASCSVNELELFTFAFDATNVNHAMIGLDVISYVPDILRTTFAEFLRKNRDKLESLFSHKASIDYYDFFINQFEKAQ